jgi:hypothetical protein
MVNHSSPRQEILKMSHTQGALVSDGSSRHGMPRVVGLRLSNISGRGPAATLEAHRMVAEKVSAFTEAASTLMTGGSAQMIIRRYRSHVQANERRLMASA